MAKLPMVLFNANTFDSGVEFISNHFDEYISDFPHPDDEEVYFFVGIFEGCVEILKLVSQFGPNTVVLVASDRL